MDIDTPIIREMRDAGVQFRLLHHSEPAFTCEAAAEQRGVPLGEMVKCLVLITKDGSRSIVACLPADKRLSMAKIKTITGIKKFSTATPEDIFRVTGFKLGSIPPLGLPADVEVLGDSQILKKRNVNISSGDPACGIELIAWDLRKLFKGRWVDLSE